MKKIYLAILLFIGIAVQQGKSQTCSFTEDFEIIDSVTSSGTIGWLPENFFWVSGFQCTVGQYGTGDSSVMTSNVFSTVGNTFVKLKFWHICKVEFFDGGIIEVSNDGGATWNQLTIAEYLGTGSMPGNKFTEVSYVDWQPGQQTPPDQTWWKYEEFDCSAFLANTASAMVRFTVADFNNNGMQGRYGWLVDDICVETAPCELFPPVITILPPFNQGLLYNTGPFTVNVDATDGSGVASVTIDYTVNSVAQAPISMVYQGGNAWQAQIPAVNVADIVCYRITAVDSSPCQNTITFPDLSQNPICFTTTTGVTLTYCNNFDTNGEWTPSSNSGSQWQLGTPSFGATNSSWSQPNSWDIDLASGYLDNTEAYLTSPVFDFTQCINCKIEMKLNYNTGTNDGDGTRLEYSLDTGVTWSLVGTNNDPNGVRWYTSASLFSTNQPGWARNSQGWHTAKRKLVEADFNQTTNPMRFRFVFNSDGFTTADGFSVDDFCIKLLQATDMAAESFVSPGASSPAGSSIPVEVIVRNESFNAQTNFDVYYSINGGAPVGPTNYSGPAIASNATANIICANMIVPAGNYTICAWTSVPGDGDATNDTTCTQSNGVQTFQITYCNDLETNGNDLYNVSPGGNQWELGMPNFGVTTGTHSGQNAWDINLNSAYVGADTAYLYTPFYDFQTISNGRMQLWINYNTEANWDGGRIDYSINGGPWQILGTCNDPNGINWYNDCDCIGSGNLPCWQDNSNGWVKAQYNLSLLNNAGLVQFRAAFNADNVIERDGFSIDDFCVIRPCTYDIGSETIDAPGIGYAAGNSTNVIVTIKNYGSANIDTINVSYSINGGAAQTSTVISTVLPNGTLQITCQPAFVVPTGNYTICVWSNVTSDCEGFNDTICGNFVGIPTIIPGYFDNFDQANAGWYATTNQQNTQWELGAPNFGNTNTPYSPPQCWDINLNSSFGNNAVCYLYTPFFNCTNAVNPEVSFYINHSTFSQDAGCNLEYTTDGATWTRVGNVNSPGSTNWYNSNLFLNNEAAWSGTSNGWKYAEYKNLTFLSNQPAVQFRFVFYSDAFSSSPTDGVSIDDFHLYIPITITAASEDVKPNNNILIPGPQLIKGKISNKGTTALDKVAVTLTVDGLNNVIVTDTLDLVALTGSALPLGSSYWHVFSQPYIATPGCHDFCIYTSYPNQQSDLDNSDDTTCAQYCVFDSTSVFPYCEDFESGPQWVTLNSYTYIAPTSWQLGLPLKPHVAGTFNGNNAWVTNLTQNYPNNDSSSLFTPVFNVQAGKCYRVSFEHNYFSELFQDGGTVEFSTDGGQLWNPIGLPGNAQWMNSFYVAAFAGPPPVPGWTGSSNGWSHAEHELQSYQNGSMMIRFRFGSDVTNNSEGWAIDQFCFEEVPGSPCVTTIQDETYKDIFLFQNEPNPTVGNTNIKFTIPTNDNVSLQLKNVVGQQVASIADREFDKGLNTINFDFSKVEPGIYFIEMNYKNYKLVRKMIVQ